MVKKLEEKMSLSPKHIKTINDIADLLYHFLPNKPHPFANQNISFQGVANELGLIRFWSVGSKLSICHFQMYMNMKKESFVNFLSSIYELVKK
jgi:hypothetical protein